MNTNEDIRNEMSEEVIELGIASVETKGGPYKGEPNGGQTGSGISED